MPPPYIGVADINYNLLFLPLFYQSYGAIARKNGCPIGQPLIAGG
jgi:hypothetical protein